MKLKLKSAVVVEGKYDKIKLATFLDALIIETNGFSVFKDKEKLELIRRLARTRGIVILTDSDTAGFSIRSRLRGSIHEGQVRNAYIPDVFGKERRKQMPSKEGKIGVEGMSMDVLMDALRSAGVEFESREAEAGDPRKITKLDLYEDRLSGCPESRLRRTAFLRRAGLPERLSANQMPEVLSALMSYEEYRERIGELERSSSYIDKGTV